MQKAIPQIAIQVAEILRNEGLVGNQVQPEIKIQEKVNTVVHQGYVCDGCGVSPIVGDCYKCSVCKDFDFCSKCEATVPHPHPFLKLKHPSQRPHALFTVINEEGQEPFKMDSNKQAEKVLGMMINECKKAKEMFNMVSQQAETTTTE